MFLSPVLLWSVLDVTVSETKPHTLPGSHRVSLGLKSQSFGKRHGKKKGLQNGMVCSAYYIQYEWMLPHTAPEMQIIVPFAPELLRVSSPPRKADIDISLLKHTRSTAGFWDLSNTWWKDRHSVYLFARHNIQTLSTNLNLLLRSFCQREEQKSPGTGQFLFPAFPVSVTQLNSCFWVNTLKTV